MAILEDIRHKGGIIVSVVIGLALFAFIIGDFIPGGRKNRGGRSLDVAEVAGTALSVQQLEAKITEMTNMYQQRMGQLDDRMRDMIHDQAWQMFINEAVMERAYDQTGLTVSPEELWDIITGYNPPQIIRSEFTNPQTGEFDRSMLMNFLKQKDIDPNSASGWAYVEKNILDEQYMKKYNTLIGKGVFVPDFIAENENQENNRKVDFDYIIQRYNTVPDSVIKISKDDIKAYYKKHQKQWEQVATRDIEYVVFDIVPSDDDRTAAQEWIDRIKPEFEQAPNPFQFIKLNTNVPADTKFLTSEQLPAQAVELFDRQPDAMVGPYQEDEALKLIRLVKVENRPDSIKVSQIILQPAGQTRDATVKLADSIKTAIEKGADFTGLAIKYSIDPAVTTNNGNMGWVYESNLPSGSLMEPVFSMKKGEVSTIDAGQYIYITQVTERGKEVKKVQIAVLQHDIVPSTRTEQLIYARASKFAIENRTEKQFDEEAAAQNLNKRVASYLGENDRQLPNLPSARQVIRWAYEAKLGQVSDVFSLDKSYAVAIVKTIRKKGFTAINDAAVASEIDMNVRREKKGAIIASQLLDATRNAQSFSELAAGLNLPVETASAVAFSTFSIPGAGIEPNLIGAVTASGEGNISSPVEGNNGVFLFTVKQIIEPVETDIESARERLKITYSNRAMSSDPLSALRKAANVVDMRNNFY
jgi:peptidyl-prolyl cis-trans isomerase D